LELKSRVGNDTNNIFISYRRGDASAYAGRLSDYLSGIIGPERVFMDVEDIASSNVFVLFTPTEDELDNPEISKKSWARGARHYECGLAAGIRLLNAAFNNFEFTFPIILVCGPRENVFHYQDNIEHYPNWDQTLSHILRIAHENEPAAQQAD